MTNFSKVEKHSFYFFIFCIPFQLRLIFHQWTWPFNEWTAAFLYFTDILFVLLLVFLLKRYLSIRSRPWFKMFPTSASPIIWCLFLFIITAFFSIFNAHIQGLSIYKFAKLVEFALFFIYLRANTGHFLNLKNIAIVISASAFFQSLIAITQYLKQGNIGLKILGESHIGPEISNVAVFLVDEEKVMRSYGTFPHPNVLAAWLLVGVFCFWYLYFRFEKAFREKWWLAGYSVMLIAIYTTYSRTIISLGFLLASILLFLFRAHFAKLKKLVFLTVITTLLFTLVYWPEVNSRLRISAGEETVTQRIWFNNIAGNITKSAPFLGIGYGQFVANLINKYKFYPQFFYQPVHNIYLLLSSETGIVGLATFLGFIAFLMREAAIAKNTFIFLGVAVLMLGFFDHFLFSLQQGSLILWLTLGLLSRVVDS